MTVSLTVDRMHSAKRLLLQQSRDKIVKDLDAIDVLDHLFSKKILTEDDTIKIRNLVCFVLFSNT